MTALTYGNGRNPVHAGAKTLREVDLLPNLAYMETLLNVVDYAAAEVQPHYLTDVADRDYLATLLIDLCLARYHRDSVGKAAVELGIVPSDSYPGDVYCSLWNDFIEMFPGLDVDQAKRVAHMIAYGWAPPVS